MSAEKGPDLEALSDLCTPWCIHVVGTLRIADHIAAGTDDVVALAAATGCDAYALHNVLGYLADKGVRRTAAGAVCAERRIQGAARSVPASRSERHRRPFRFGLGNTAGLCPYRRIRLFRIFRLAVLGRLGRPSGACEELRCVDGTG